MKPNNLFREEYIFPPYKKIIRAVWISIFYKVRCVASDILDSAEF